MKVKCDEELTLLTKCFKQFMRKGKIFKRKPYENKKFSEDILLMNENVLSIRNQDISRQITLNTKN